MADGALRCFASLADRYTRKSIDPAPLAANGLIDDLLKRMNAASGPVGGASFSNTPSSMAAMTPGAEGKAAGSISTVISLLSTLCRGSPTVTHDLMRSELPDAIESALAGDERYVHLNLCAQRTEPLILSQT